MEIEQVKVAFRTLLMKEVSRPLDLCTQLHVDEFIEVAKSEDEPVLDIETTFSSIEQLLDDPTDMELMMVEDNDTEDSINEGSCSPEDCIVDLDTEESCESPIFCVDLLSSEESASLEEESDFAGSPECEESFRQDDKGQE